NLTFSVDGKRLAYVARRGEQWLVVADGKDGKLYEQVAGGTLGFTHDGRSLAYAAQASKEGTAGVLVIDGEERTRYERILPRPNQTLHVGADSFSYVAVRDGAYYWVEERRIK